MKLNCLHVLAEKRGQTERISTPKCTAPPLQLFACQIAFKHLVPINKQFFATLCGNLSGVCQIIFTPMIAMKKESPPVLKDRQNLNHDDNNGIKHQHLQQQQQQMLISDLLDALPVWDRNLAPGAGAGTSSSQASSNTDSSYTMSSSNVLGGSVGSPNSSDFFGPLTSDSSPASGSSGSTGSRSSVTCSWCEISASARCVDCNELMCNDCLLNHRRSPLLANHTLLPLSNVPSPTLHSSQCDSHKEIYRFVCETCKKLVCQYCTLREHRDHIYVQLSSYVDGAIEKIEAALESSSVGTKCVKGSIDKALSFSRATERDANDLIQSIRKSFRQLLIAVEERERQLIDQVERIRQRKQTQLSDQTAGLRSALAGLAQNSEMLLKAADNLPRMDPIEIAQVITKGQCQLEQFAAIYQNLQPKQEYFGYVPPSFAIVHEIRAQGDLVVSDTKMSPPNGFLTAVGAGRRPLVRDVPPATPPLPIARPFESTFNIGVSPILSTSPIATLANSLGPGARVGQCIPGTYEKVIVRKSLVPTTAFACDGHEDGQVSRPWGICVDKEGNILISDRRNNRVQVFYPDGGFKFKFGTKGVGNGQFDLPAGICVDCDNRIIVVDKDNHRVQIFTSQGRFLLKFGCYGREYGQFQYPWDVAVNSRRQIIVTDSRNHRIQQFDSEGRFIKHFVFDNYNHSKGPASPRGVCFTPAGDIIVSDFDNHCLLLIDSDLQQVLSAKGHEGTGIQEFNRPSGICCDDDGNIIIADSKNQRVIVFTETLEYMWTIEIRPSLNPHFPSTLDEKDRPCDVALLPDGRIVIMVELSPDARDSSNPLKKFVQVY